MEEGTTSALVRNGQGEVEIRTGSRQGNSEIKKSNEQGNLEIKKVNGKGNLEIKKVNGKGNLEIKKIIRKRNLENNKGGELNWDPEIQGYVLGGFYWGYLITQMPAGWIATRYGGKIVTGWSMFVSMIFTLLTPFAARTSFIFAVVVRIVIGLSTGAVFPAMHSLLGNWVPPSERSKFTAMTYSAKLGPASMLIGLGYVDCSQTALAIVLVILAVSSAGFQYSGWVVNHIDIAPSYAGILLGISNSLASTTGIISPIIVGAITEKVSFLRKKCATTFRFCS
ncbi:SLC17A5 [Mytilus edulis]|uniref:SLC17A5 n=1 Tax=Mytilus edulis TaxID=6550 RepID=A0A8S3QG06_MYTED|nr:SLC17A5 [Mytilus edulis]